MVIESLHCYPVKALRGVSLRQAVLGRQGLAFDRHWMLVDGKGDFVTQRRLPGLATIDVALTATRLLLSHPDAGQLSLALSRPDRPAERVTVWKDACMAIEEPVAFDDWLGKALGAATHALPGKVRLMRFDERSPRLSPRLPESLPADARFADGFAYLVAFTASLDALNRLLGSQGERPVAMSRFRPNLVVRSSIAWAENACQRLETVGQMSAGTDTQPASNIRLALCEPCKRCKVITVDQDTGEVVQPGEPLATLVRLDQPPGFKGGYFGQNAKLLSAPGERLRVGDSLLAS